jgi:hypothetical protein
MFRRYSRCNQLGPFQSIRIEQHPQRIRQSSGFLHKFLAALCRGTKHRRTNFSFKPTVALEN